MSQFYGCLILGDLYYPLDFISGVTASIVYYAMAINLLITILLGLTLRIQTMVSQ